MCLDARLAESPLEARASYTPFFNIVLKIK